MSYDWEAIEREYRMGHKTIRTLCAEFGVKSPGTISKRAKKHGWTQDKSEEVRQRTRAGLMQETDGGNTDGNKTGNTPTPEDIERQVRTNIAVIRDHRIGIKKNIGLVTILAGQLEAAALNRADLEEEVEKDTEGEDGNVDYRRRNALMRAISLPSHAAVLRDLSTAQKNLIMLERQAYNLDATPEDSPKETRHTNIDLEGAERAFNG